MKELLKILSNDQQVMTQQNLQVILPPRLDGGGRGIYFSESENRSWCVFGKFK